MRVQGTEKTSSRAVATTLVAAVASWVLGCAGATGDDDSMAEAGQGAGTAGAAGAIAGESGSSGASATAGSSGTSAGASGASGASAGTGQGGAGGAAGTGSSGTMGGASGVMAQAGASGAAGSAGMAAGAGAAGSAIMDGPDNPDPCTPSEAANANGSGSGPHDVVIETNTDPGINEGTIYRPADLGSAERYPIFIWGEGGCAQDGLSNQTANSEIASHGYFVIADGTPSGGGGNRSLGGADAGAPMIAYIDWAIAENNKPCSAYYHSLDISKVATNGFSCGGLMAQGTASDPRVTTWMITSSGGFSASQALYDATHGPVFILLGGPSDIAYENGKRDYDNLAMLDWPLMLFSKDIGHGGDLFRPGGGDFTKLNLAWINWWLKGDEGPSGKGFLVGDGCTLCNDSSWETASANIP